jgi:nanoRNase/pAp phosphatase (c-di-AMP/oligoRNAs hydrolase)
MEYLVGSKEIFLDYLNKLGKKDRIGVLSHADLDGVASAVLINEILKQKKMKVKELKFLEHKKEMFKESRERFVRKKINKLFICDISIASYTEEFQELRKQFDVFLIDHHPSDIKGNNIIQTKTTDCATFTIYELAKNDFDLSGLEWLVCAAMVSDGAYRDASNFQFIKQYYPNINPENLFSSEIGELSKKISSTIIYFKGKENKIYNLILKNRLKSFDKYYNLVEKEVQKLVNDFRKGAEFYPDENLYFYYAHPKYSVSSTVTTILSTEQPEKSFVFVSDIDGEPDFYKASSRSQKGGDMNLLMKKGIEGLENATGGGHVVASAARFMKKDFEKFKENLLK